MPINYTSQERDNLLAILRLGRASAIKASTLAESLGYPTSGNQVILRSLIKECIEIDGDLIGAETGNPPGFFLISTLTELERYLDSLENRTRKDNDRRSALITNWNNHNRVHTTKQILIIQ